MKRIYISLFVALVALLMPNTIWAADPDLENDYTLVKSMTWGDGTSIAGSGSCAYTAYDTGNKRQQALTILTTPEDAAGWIAMQTWTDGSGKGWWNRADKGLYCVNAGRSACIFGDDLTTGWLVVFECSQAASNVMTLTNASGEPDGTFSYVASEDGKSYYCTITAVENAYVGFYGNKNAGFISTISVYKPNHVSVPTTYSVKYIDMEGNILKENVSYNAVAGATIVLSDADKANFTVGETTYIYDSDDCAETTVAEGGTTVVTVKFHAAANFNYTVNEVCGESNARVTNGTSYETANIILGYRKYNAVNGQLYKKDATNKQYNYSFKLTQDNQVENITYTIVDGTNNVVFCAEGEDIEGLTPITEGNTTIRSSNSASAFASADTKITTLAPGKYKIHAIIYDCSSKPNSDWTFMAGAVQVASFNCTSVNIQEFDSQEFVISCETDLVMLKAGSVSRGLDAIYIVKTGDVTADEAALLNAKEALQTAIAIASNINPDGLADAIAAAQAALNAEDATVESLTLATQTLEAAIKTYFGEVLPRFGAIVEGLNDSTLNAAYTNAQTILEKEGVTPQELATAMQQIIATAQDVAPDHLQNLKGYAIKYGAEDAVALVDSALAAIQEGNVSKIIATMTAVKEAATPLATSILTQIIGYAQNYNGFADDVTEANAALEGGNYIIMITTAKALYAKLITAANDYVASAKAIPTEGKEGVEDLNTAIEAAEQTLAAQDADFSDINTAISNLVAAVKAFEEASNPAPVEGICYSWESPAGEPIEWGGTIAYVNGEGDRLNYLNNDYYTICLNGKKANVYDETASINAGKMVVTLDKTLAEGDTIAFTGYINKNTSTKASAWIIYENGATAESEIFGDESNIYTAEGVEATGTINTKCVVVSAEAAGSKTITLTRGQASTNLFITKLQIIEKAAAETTVVTWVAADQGYENATEIDTVNIDENIKAVFDKNTNANTPKYYTSGTAVRIYGGNTFTVFGEKVAISKIELTFGAGDKSEYYKIITDRGTYSEGIWTSAENVNTNIVKFTVDGTSGNRRIAAIKVTYSIDENAAPLPQPVHIANTAETAYTVAEAIELIDAGEALSETVFVKGIVSQVDKFDETNKYITYWISADGTTEGSQFECYRGKGINGADFVSVDDIEIGAEVIVKGTIKKYGEIYEFNQNNELVSYKAPEATVIIDPNAKGQQNNPYLITDEEFLEMVMNLDTEGSPLSDVIYVKGYITNIDEVSPDYGNARFKIAAVKDKDAEIKLSVYRARYLDNSNFTAEDQIGIFDEVVICGQIKWFNGSPEFVQGCYVYSQQKDSTTVIVNPQPTEPQITHTWDFTKWSEATIANLKADAAASKLTGWSDVEKRADAEADADPTEAAKDNCFWLTDAEGGELTANGVVIEELKGLLFDANYTARRYMAIAVNYPSTSLGDYNGASYLWLGSKSIECFTIPSVKAGSIIKMGVESHKNTDARGVKLLVNGIELTDPEGNAVAAPTAYTEQTWQVPAGDSPVDIVVMNTNGCHIYFIDAEQETKTPETSYTFEWVAADQGYENMQDFADAEISLEGYASMSCEIGSGKYTPKYYDNGMALRFYAGNTMTFRGNDITKIVITCDTTYAKFPDISASTGEVIMDENLVIWTGNSDEVAINVLTNQLRMLKLQMICGENEYIGKLGDVNNDDEINITDVVLIIDDILQHAPKNYNATLADVNKDGLVDVTDVVNVIDAILGKIELSRGAEPIDRSAYTAFQMDLTIPAGYVLESVSLTDIAKNSHSLAYAMLPDGRCRVVVCSMDNEALSGAWDEVISLNLRGKGDAQMTIDRAVFVTIDGERHELMMNPTSIAQISNLNTQTSNLYDLQGRKVGENAKGILIENGKKTIRK